MDRFVIRLDRPDGTPVFRQIAERVRQGIAHGLLAPNDRLPSARSLAAQLGLARGTVDAAYALLAGEGYVQGRGPAGTVVAPGLRVPAVPPCPPVEKSVAAAARALPGPLPFRLGLPALDAFPRTLWSRLTVRAARRIAPAALAYPDPAGLPVLREAIATYLRVARGIACDAHDVLITAGFQGALALITHAMLRPDDRVIIEDPGYFLARDALAQAGGTLVPSAVDAAGLDVALAASLAPAARFAVVTPTHQAPMGVALSLQRRLSLLDWAADTGAWVIEDDYDSEFRYTGHPLPALKSLDLTGRVLYAGSFSKVLFPGLRLGYLVPPVSLQAPLLAAARTLQAGLPVLEQQVVAAFMTEGHFARHLRRMRSLYGSRRSALAAALRAVFGSRLDLQLQAGGMHLLARLADGPSDAEMVRRALDVGLGPNALSAQSVAGHAGEGLLLGFTNVPEADALALTRRLAKAIR
ncbi:PLP-dependent aminotransferase family protein [Rhodopila sp.]|uniref:MocR-like pyridoxine biosynthesis transcription factor PdxR n=1 Tax=Rhodopila sp. TaxID=2480087 RepID=UPI002C54D88E|nr:PLP-dependent aminotransferase family protein [Rhodopila sp.]HVZ10569.1 PLP-dependent aminotransferase family protein [Rhodopila sp.]